MVKQYPHTMIIQGMAGDSTQDAKGNLQAAPRAEPVEQKCRYEVNSSIKEIKTADGNTVNSQGTVYMPPKAADVKQGTIVEVQGMIKTTALYFVRAQLHCMLYL